MTSIKEVKPDPKKIKLDLVKDPGQILFCFRLKLRDYEYEFKYKPGKINTNADALSRNPIIENSADEVREEKQPARLLPMLARQANKRKGNTSQPTSKTSESESRSKPVIQTKKGFTSRIATCKPSTLKSQKSSLSRSKSSASTSAELDKITIRKRLICR